MTQCSMELGSRPEDADLRGLLALVKQLPPGYAVHALSFAVAMCRVRLFSSQCLHCCTQPVCSPHIAAERLRNEPDTPVLNISLDVGYRTLSSFNRAFRDIQNATPTEYRQQCLGADIS